MWLNSLSETAINSYLQYLIQIFLNSICLVNFNFPVILNLHIVNFFHLFLYKSFSLGLPQLFSHLPHWMFTWVGGFLTSSFLLLVTFSCHWPLAFNLVNYFHILCSSSIIYIHTHLLWTTKKLRSKFEHVGNAYLEL